MKLIRIMAWLIVPVGIILAITCDGPIGPKPGQKDYVCYFWSLDDSRGFLELHTANGVLDSFDLPAHPDHGMEVSADGKRLYVNTDTGCVVFDTRSWLPVGKLPLGPTAAVRAVSPDNRLLDVASGGDTYILSTSGYGVVYSDTSGLYGTSFSKDSRSLYGVGSSNSVDYVYRVQLDSGNAVRRWSFPGIGLTQVRPSPDERYFYARYVVPIRARGLLAWDIAADSLRHSFTRTPGLGDIEVPPNGSKVYFTNYPHSIDLTSLIFYSFAYYDVADDSIHQVELREYDWPGPTAFDCYGEIEVTPDGEKMIALDGLNSGLVIRYDLVTEVVDTSYTLFAPDRGGRFIYLTCPNGR